MEVYLNVAEMGEGVFGVEAAARRYWQLDAAELGPQRSARLMAVLPDPQGRSPVSGSSLHRPARRGDREGRGDDPRGRAGGLLSPAGGDLAVDQCSLTCGSVRRVMVRPSVESVVRAQPCSARWCIP